MLCKIHFSQTPWKSLIQRYLAENWHSFHAPFSPPTPHTEQRKIRNPEECSAMPDRWPNNTEVFSLFVIRLASQTSGLSSCPKEGFYKKQWQWGRYVFLNNKFQFQSLFEKTCGSLECDLLFWAIGHLSWEKLFVLIQSLI